MEYSFFFSLLFCLKNTGWALNVKQMEKEYELLVGDVLLGLFVCCVCLFVCSMRMIVLVTIP